MLQFPVRVSRGAYLLSFGEFLRFFSSVLSDEVDNSVARDNPAARPSNLEDLLSRAEILSGHTVQQLSMLMPFPRNMD